MLLRQAYGAAIFSVLFMEQERSGTRDCKSQQTSVSTVLPRFFSQEMCSEMSKNAYINSSTFFGELELIHRVNNIDKNYKNYNSSI